MRKVIVQDKQGTRTGVFLGFGTDYEELRGEVGMFTAAIVEWPDGGVELIPFPRIMFVDRSELRYT